MPADAWRPVAAPPSSSAANLGEWKSHPRLQKHLRRFLGSPDQGRVLSRYHRQVQQMGREELLRVAVHVGAWVALLPLEQAVSRPGDGEIAGEPSPVQLLARILRLRGRANITAWLQGVLHLVALRLQEVRKIAELGRNVTHWTELRRSMPKAIWRNLRTQSPSIPESRSLPVTGAVKSQLCEGSSGRAVGKRKTPLLDPQITPHGADDATDPDPAARGEAQDRRNSPHPENRDSGQDIAEAGQGQVVNSHQDRDIFEAATSDDKVVRRFQRDGMAFSNAGLEERAFRIASLEQRLVALVVAESWDRLCALLREAAAALSGPRLVAALPQGESAMPEEAKERLQGNLQGRLRKLICNGLGYLDLSDSGTAALLEPGLSFMGRLIDKFAEAHARSLEEALAGKQWGRLQHLLSGSQECVSQLRDEHFPSEPFEDGQEEVTLAKSMGIGRADVGLRGPTTKGGVYTPNLRIQSLALVRETSSSVVLTCNRCGDKLTSSWLFERRPGLFLTLTPQHGHNKCGGQYTSVDEVPCKKDFITDIDICEHGCQRAKCYRCGGHQICKHQKQRHSCKLCKAAGLVKPRNNENKAQATHHRPVAT
ncbi:unnamed protein product [Polarella glacialis]|uniref:Uncharacterized protein n=1 Tax=Polarella glacialis TaxID=89957 RepID=A0A813EK67_POLGL|nr:unnamed protein product [Polarella glacialis]